MAEVPEHLLKRAAERKAALEAKKQAEAEAAGGGAPAEAAVAPAAAAAGGPSAEEVSASNADAEKTGKIPAHLLARSQAAKAKAAAGASGGGEGEGAAAGGGTLTTTAPATGAAAAARGGRRRPRARAGRSGRTHPAAADRRQGGLHPRRQVDADRQGQRVAPPARRRVRGRAGHDRLPAGVLGLRQRSPARAGQLQPDPEPVEGAVVLPRSAGAAHAVPSDGGRRHDPRYGPGRHSGPPATSTRTRATNQRIASSRSPSSPCS